MTLHLRNVMQCPACGFKTTVKMSTHTQQMLYCCGACGVETQATSEQCCIFCLLGRYPCPQQQSVSINKENSLGK